MTRAVLYVAHPLRPSQEEAMAMMPSQLNIERAQRWLAWLRKSFPETTFIAPWIASVTAGADDTDPAQREAGIADACAVIERCDGIVLCGGRISEGMRREAEHGIQAHSAAESYTNDFEVYDLTSIANIPVVFNQDPAMTRIEFHTWARLLPK